MLARHWQKHASDFGKLANVFVKRLPNVVAKRHFVLSLASNFAGVTAKATASVNKPSEFFAVGWRLDQFRPFCFWLKQIFSNFVVLRRRVRGE